jgi:hypothetical protein
MSERRSSLQHSDSSVIALAKTVFTECTAHAAEWNIDPARLSALGTTVANAETAYDANSNKATKNATTVAYKDAAIGELKHVLAVFITYLEITLSVPDAALAAMGLRPRHRTASKPLPPPDELLLLSVTKQYTEVTVYALRPEHGQPTLSVAPKRYHGFALRYKVEGDPIEKTVISTRLHHTLFFGNEDAGKHITLTGAWVNPRLETGPWCPEITEIIG